MSEQFSAGALTELQTALDDYLAAAPARDAQMQHAMGRICAEAHAQSLGPEKMLIAVKRAWAALTIGYRTDEERKGRVLDTAVSVCIAAYYGYGPRTPGYAPAGSDDSDARRVQ